MKMIRWMALLLVLVTLAGCSKRKNENLAKVEPTYTEEHVVKLIGKPDSIETSGIPGLSSTTYHYNNKDSAVTIIFSNGRVIRIDGSFE